jgi:deoxyadenosine/deoxycytidine kinase
MKYNFITIEGNIGAGKTTLAQLLAEKLNARLILEEFAENPFLSKFYGILNNMLFPSKYFLWQERYKQLKELVYTKDLFRRVTVSDYLFTKCLLFAKVNLSDDEFRLYQKLFDIIHQQLLHPDILIYLHAPVERLQENIKKRNREYEQSIPDQYLLNIQEAYTTYIRQQNMKTLFIDATYADFEGNENQIAVVLNALEQEYSNGPHYFTLP